MNKDLLYFNNFETDKHEFISFESRPKDPDVVTLIQDCCRNLARRAELTRRGWAEDELKLQMSITIDGKDFCSDDMSELYKGILALPDAERFSIDATIKGREGCFTISSVSTEEGGLLDEVSLEGVPDLYSIAANARETESFVYKCIEFIPDHGAFNVCMIEDGKWVDLDSRMSPDVVKSDLKDWWSWELNAGVEYIEERPALTEELKSVVRRYLQGEELTNVECSWEEAEEFGDKCTFVLYNTQWIGDLNPLNAMLEEVNAIMAKAEHTYYGAFSDTSLLIDQDRFGVAKIEEDQDGFHVVGLYF